MFRDFAPFMTEQRLDRFQRYMQEIDAGPARRLPNSPLLATRAPDRPRAQSDSGLTLFTQFEHDWPNIDADMSSMLSDVHANVGSYRALFEAAAVRRLPVDLRHRWCRRCRRRVAALRKTRRTQPLLVLVGTVVSR